MDAFERAAHESAARALIEADNIRGAEARLRNMLASNANDARALALLAHCRFREKDKKQGLEIARSAAKLDPDDPLVRSMLTYALQQAGKGKAARDEQLELAEGTAAESPQESDAIFNLAIARLNSNQYRKAKGRGQMDQLVVVRDLIDDAERFASDAHELINVAYMRLREWNHEAAASLAQRAMQLDPTRPEIFLILAECALARRQNLDAYELALEALRLSPGDLRAMRLLTRARARSNRLLRPFASGIDWIVEMDRNGLVIVPVLIGVVGLVFAVSLGYDLGRIEAGQSPAVILSAASGAALMIAVVSYCTAVAARLRIRRDLRRISLPKF
jgi:tetratricopeptide (TPR) repeat protein